MCAGSIATKMHLAFLELSSRSHFPCINWLVLLQRLLHTCVKDHLARFELEISHSSIRSPMSICSGIAARMRYTSVHPEAALQALSLSFLLRKTSVQWKSPPWYFYDTKRSKNSSAFRCQNRTTQTIDSVVHFRTRKVGKKRFLWHCLVICIFRSFSSTAPRPRLRLSGGDWSYPIASGHRYRKRNSAHYRVG